MKRKILTLTGVVIILIIGVTIGIFYKKAQETSPPPNFQNSVSNNIQNRDQSTPTDTRPGRDCVSNAQPIFTHDFTDLSQIEKIAPLGGVGGGSPGRSYVTIKEGKVPVYAPMDATLETIVYARRGGAETPGEYGLYFRASCEVTFLLDHIDEVVDKIKALAPKDPAASSATQYGTAPQAKIKAGELLGYSDGTPLAHTFDFLVESTEAETEHINPVRWTWNQTTNAVCPYDLYAKELKDKYFSLLRERDATNNYVPAKSCGSPSQDAAGTLSGGWFQGAANNMQGKWLALGQMFSWSEAAMRENGNFVFSLRDYGKKPKPDEIKVGQSVCYQGYANNWIWLNLFSETQMKAAMGQGTCPADFPEAKAETWER
ncbi:MAG: hypothetical protein CO141_03325 [Candidatus Moranbacteria bacterium CG_4_9_14_3_um_filter_42_9]|nr:MAG: hypothetical protein CO141_03325 [Candidatus Moranbacteria bacterium CG_4_9_14_3_um_filter_42_9]